MEAVDDDGAATPGEPCTLRELCKFTLSNLEINMADVPKTSKHGGKRPGSGSKKKKKKVYPSGLQRANELKAKKAAAVHELAELSPGLQQEKFARLPVEAQKQAAHAFFCQAAQVPELTEKEVVKDTAQRLGTLSYFLRACYSHVITLGSTQYSVKKAVKKARNGQLGARSRKKHTPAPVEAEKKGPRLPTSRYKAVAKLLAEKFLRKGFTITLGNVVYMLKEALGIPDLTEDDVREVLKRLVSIASIPYCTKTLFQLPPATILYMPCDVMMSIATTLHYYASQIIRY
jgi:hypothetical protein